MVNTLVIAYGNRLRGDDGIGPAAGEAVASWQIPGIKVVIVQQLVPELIAEMKHAERVLFVDAVIADYCNGAFACALLEHAKTPRPLGHHETPRNLLAMLREVEGAAPTAWMVTIAGSAFDHGEQMSEIAAKNLRAALAWIRTWLTEPSCTKSA
jgi:hydrogenase maturation protease